MNQKRSFVKRGRVDQAGRHQNGAGNNDFYRRTALNKALGMTARNPYAFQLSTEELEQAEIGAANSNPPVPIATAGNGLRMLIDPHREENRRRERDLIPSTSLDNRRARYASYPGVLS